MFELAKIEIPYWITERDRGQTEKLQGREELRVRGIHSPYMSIEKAGVCGWLML
jgi:hypothetical protein